MDNTAKINGMYAQALTLISEQYTIPFEKYPSTFPEVFKGEQVFLRDEDVKAGKKHEDCRYVIVSKGGIDNENENVCFFLGVSRLDPTSSIAAYIEKDQQILHFQEHATPMCTYEAANWRPDMVLYLVDKSTVPMEEDEFRRVMMKDNLEALFSELDNEN